MSWRNPSTSQPAAPITSSGSNPYFPSEPSARRPRRTINHNTSLSNAPLNSAIVHLARAKQDMDDDAADAASIRSSRSSRTVGGGARSLWGFGRPASVRSAASSRRTVRRTGNESDDCESMEMSGGGKIQEGDEEEVLRDDGEGVGVAEGLERPEGRNGAVPPVVKRTRKVSGAASVRTNGTSSRSSTRAPLPSTWTARGSPAPASPAASTSPQSLEEPTPLSLDAPAPRSHLAPPSIRSVRHAAPAISTSLSTKFSGPAAPSLTSPNTRSSSTSFPSTKSGPTFTPKGAKVPSASASASALLKPRSPNTSPHTSPQLDPVGAAPRQRKKSTLANSSSWFGGLSAAAAGDAVEADTDRKAPSPANRSPRLKPATAEGRAGSIRSASSARSGQAPQTKLASASRSLKAKQAVQPAPEPAAAPADSGAAEVGRGVVPSRSWMSLVTGARAPSGGDLPPMAEAIRQAGEQGRAAMETGEDEGDVTPRREGTDSTLKAPSLPTVADDDRTPSATLPASRSSWWLWGGANLEPPPESAPSVAGSESQSEPEPEPMEVDEEPAPALPEVIIPEEPGKGSWLRTLWGEFPEEAAARKQREAAEAAARVGKATSVRSKQAGEDAPPASPALSATSMSAESSSASGVQQAAASAVPQQVQALKPKASWNLFGSVRGAKEPLPDSTSAPTPIPGSGASSLKGAAGPSKSVLGRSPKVGSSLAPSAASIRSQATATSSEAPSSPRFGPVQDGPPRPLTGSNKPSSASLRGLADEEPVVENLVLPTYEDIFTRAPRSFPPKKTTLTKLTNVVASYWFGQPPSPTMERKTKEGNPLVHPDPAEKLPKALEVMEEPSRLGGVRRVVCVGVHGWFPHPRLKSVLGEPTGTSVKFATMMHDSVQAYLESKYEAGSFNILPIPLEGEGQVDDRVNRLYDQLVSRDEWVQALKKADVVFLATHSQGSVVSTQLLARMLDNGLITGTQTHMLAMCAIAQGPFVHLSTTWGASTYFNYIETPAAKELFEFQDPESALSIKFLACLQQVLSAGVKVTVVGSINDQVVPLYSAMFSGITHPGLIRAVYIDSAAFRTSDFLANLVVFAARLRNAGLTDHDLVYHVSEALAGALTGVGHSKIYEEPDVYTLAVRYQLETTALNEPPTSLQLDAPPAAPLAMSFNPRGARNAYLLTWSVRGLIEDPQVRELFGDELARLRESFETWRPATKALKEVKLKLEGIRMLPRVAGKL